MEQRGTCIRARLITLQTDGAYTSYVFQNMDDMTEYVMCTRMPNWNGTEPTPWQEGFLEYKFVVAGRDTYYEKLTQTFKAYQYTDTYFLDFVPITHVLNNGVVTPKNMLVVS